jgi:outer membrane murein-binding lipoprotein Lpp
MGIWRGVAAAAACGVVLVSGCGGGDDKPAKKADPAADKAKTVSGWIDQFKADVASGDCKRLKVTAPFANCSLKTTFRGARATGSKSFGAGAVVDYAGVHYPDQKADTAQAILLQRFDGRWIQAFDYPGEPPEVGSSAPSAKPFEAAANAWTDAVAKGDCKAAFKYAAINEPPRVYCGNVVAAKASQHQVFAGNPSVRPTPVGGTANIQFFRYSLKVPKSVNPRGIDSYATLAVIHLSKRVLAQGGATNPYLVVQPIASPTPPGSSAAASGYTDAVKATYVKNCKSGGESDVLCGCQIDMISKAMPYKDFKTPTARFDRALPGVKKACKLSSQASGGQDRKDVTRVVLGGDLVPGFICSADVSTDKVLPLLGGSREKCDQDSGNGPPDNTIKITALSVKGDRASAKGTDKQGHFTVELVRGGDRWLIDGFANNG